MTPTEIDTLAESHLNAWFSADPVSNPTTLREHVAAAIMEALERQAHAYQKGADILRYERDQALAAHARIIMRREAK